MSVLKTKILIVDDDKAILESCAKLLRNNGHIDVVTINDSVRAEAEISTGEYDLIISDLSMPKKDGLDLLRAARDVSPETPFVIFSAYGNVETAVEAMRQGAFDFIEKPFKAARLRVVVEKSLRHRDLLKENRELGEQLIEKNGFDNLIGTSLAMQQVFKMISRVAQSDTNVTIIGESGTGKELVARSVHANSLRKSKPFVPVNCGAFPEHLFESELFGYEKGAFTGAHRRKPGLLEFADGGTFFLDEICELRLPLQVKLLRMLQERNIRRVGGTELIDLDVRIISASNQSLESATESGSLRQDLYYRLNVITIALPPLRQRIIDIPFLCEHFIAKYSKLTPKNLKGVSEEGLACLEKYHWPGNVRELENVIERAVTLTTGEWIQPDDLPEALTCTQNNALSVEIGQPFKEAKEGLVANFEKEYITKILVQHNGNISKAAAHSGIDRRTFHRLIKRYKIDAHGMKVQP